uniref:DLG associated protein 2 n=1 Tax=Macaca mulatta TaxID=9544 RepID=A0A5F8AKH2_MACMU
MASPWRQRFCLAFCRSIAVSYLTGIQNSTAWTGNPDVGAEGRGGCGHSPRSPGTELCRHLRRVCCSKRWEISTCRCYLFSGSQGAVFTHTRLKMSRARWLKPVIPALWEAETGGSQGQEIETILANTVKPRLY